MTTDNQLNIAVVATTQLQGLQEAQDAIGDLSNSVKAQTTALSGGAQAASQLTSALSSTAAASTSGASALTTAGNAAVSAGHGTAGFYRELLVLGHEMAMGRYTRFGGSMMVLAERSGSLVSIFSAIKAVATPMNLAIAATVGILAAIVDGAHSAEAALAEIKVAYASVGNEYLFNPTQIKAASDALEQSGVSAKDAEAALTGLARATDLTADEQQKVLAALPDLVAKFGDAKEATKAVVDAVDDTSASYRRFHDEMANTNPDLLYAGENALAAGDKSRAAAIMIDYLTESAKGLTDKGITPLGRAWTEFNNSLGAAGFSSPIANLHALGAMAADAAAKVLTLVQAMRLSSQTGESMGQATRQIGVQNSGQTYDMDQSTAYLEQQKKLYKTESDGIDLVVAKDKNKTDILLHNISVLQAAQAAANQKAQSEAANGNASGATADSAISGQISAKIVSEQQQLNDEQTKQAEQAQTQQLQKWEEFLTGELTQQQLFGDKAKAFELSYWQQKQAVATAGTAEYKEISQKIYDLQSGIYDKDVAAQQKAEQQKVEAAKKSYDAETASVLKYYDDLAAQYKNDYTKWLQVEDQKQAVINALYGQGSSQAEEQQKKITDAQAAELTKTTDQWKGYFSTFNSGILGMVKGTETFHQSFLNVMDSSLSKFLTFAEGIAAKWVATELTQTQATVAANAVRTASNAAAQAAGSTAAVQAGSTTVMNNAKQAFSGAYAATSSIPVVGPILAPAAGAAAFAAVAAMDTMASFDVGAWNVPGDMVAKIHQGETILPKSFAEDFRNNMSGGASGGGSGGITINAVDSRSVARLLRSNGGAVASSLANAVRMGNSSFA